MEEGDGADGDDEGAGVDVVQEVDPGHQVVVLLVHCQQVPGLARVLNLLPEVDPGIWNCCFNWCRYIPYVPEKKTDVWTFESWSFYLLAQYFAKYSQCRFKQGYQPETGDIRN